MEIILYPRYRYAKAKIVLSLLGHEISVPEASARYGVPENVLQTWIDSLIKAGTAGLPEDYPKARKITEEQKRIPIHELPLSARTSSLLKDAGIEVLGQLVALKESEFRNLVRDNRKSENEILETLKLLAIRNKLSPSSE